MARKELGKMLLESGIINKAQLEEAVQNQVIFGGKLGTNLLELGYVDEQTLSRFLAKQHGVPTIDWNALNYIRPGLFKLFSKKLAQKYDAFPVKLDKNKLYVVMSDPSHVGTISEMSFATGKTIRPLILPEVRIYDLLHRYYGIGRELRYINVAMMAKAKPDKPKDESKKPLAKISPVKSQEESLKAKIKGDSAEDLMSEEEFSHITDASFLKIESPSAPAPVKEKPAAPQAEVAIPPGRPVPRPGPQPFREMAQAVYSVLVKNNVEQYMSKKTIQEFIKKFVSDQLKDRVFPLRYLANYLLTEANVQINWLEMVLAEIQKLETQLNVLILMPGEQTPEAAPPKEEEIEEPEEILELEEVGTAEDIEELERLEAVEEVEEPEEEEPIEEEKPIEKLTLAEAQQRLFSDLQDRNDISRIVLGFAQSYFKRSALFTVRENKVFGWDGLGGILNQKLVESIMLNLDEPSVFKTVHDTSCHYLGPMLKVSGNDEFLEKLGGQHPNSVFLIPIVVNGRPVYMLYGDNGEGQNVPFDIGELLILAQKIPQSIHELIRKKRASYEAREG